MKSVIKMRMVRIRKAVSVAMYLSVLCGSVLQSNAQKIDREALVRRHNVHITKIDSLSSLSVGNGDFAFTVDATGMQSFPEAYANGVPLGTESVWGWHSFPNTENLKIEEAQKTYDLEGRKISYTVQPKEPEISRKAVEYFRVNPHRLQLGNIGLEIKMKDGSLATVNDIKNIDQQLDLWTGTITSSFRVEDIPVKVITVCDPYKATVAFKINSPLLSQQRISVRLRFPYPTGQFKDVGDNWNNEDAHSSLIDYSFQNNKSGLLTIQRKLDTTGYRVTAFWSGKAEWKGKQKHYFLITPAITNSESWEFSCHFNPERELKIVGDFDLISKASQREWKKFWLSGGAVDFSGSTDPRAFEIERRVVLSQYLTRIQCSGDYPPQETGLTYNSWYGKPHLEMHWWHAEHYAQWGRPELMEKSLDWYFKVADKAFAIAKRQGFDGLRWQKMTDNQGDESPSSVGAFLIWQQPHFIYMAEMLYRSNPSSKILKKYKDLLFATADFMASFPTYDEKTKKYNLGKGLIPAQECFNAVATFNPTYELAYWSWALQTAQKWRIRLGMKRNEKWDTIINNLAPLPQLNGVYLATESTPDCYQDGSKYLTDHPAVLAAYSTLPASNGLDTIIMKHTLDTVWNKWQWNKTWGWDFPLTAMTAARLHMPEKAIEALLMPIQTNTYLVNGHNYQDDRLTIYLPGNGGVLNAVAMMCTGTDADNEIDIGFPKDGKWKVRWEGLKKMF
jgi:protein-glucosylgalactosylhydroxylysine glucosidase